MNLAVFDVFGRSPLHTKKVAQYSIGSSLFNLPVDHFLAGFLADIDTLNNNTKNTFFGNFVFFFSWTNSELLLIFYLPIRILISIISSTILTWLSFHFSVNNGNVYVWCIRSYLFIRTSCEYFFDFNHKESRFEHHGHIFFFCESRFVNCANTMPQTFSPFFVTDCLTTRQ